MKKLLFVAAIALCAMSCGNKAENTEATVEEAPEVVEVVETEATEENAPEVIDVVEEVVETVQEAVAE